jgi:hypothetical protein
MNQNNAVQPVLTDDEIQDIADLFDIYGAKPEFARAIESAVLSKLRAPVADERISLRGAANLAFNALHECKPAKGAEKQYSDSIQALQSALHDIAYTLNRTATPKQFADHLQREARAALASAPVAGEADDEEATDAWRRLALQFDGHRMQALGHLRAMLADPQAHAERAAEFLAAPPLSGEQVLAERIRALAAPQARPSDDELWDQTLAERDEYHDIADKLADAIADHLLVEIGEHSSSNCPWMRALDAIQNAAPQASEADIATILAFIFQRFGQPCDAGELPDRVVSAVRRLERRIPAIGENIRTGAPYDDPAFEALCREHGIWGTAQSALCAVFWRQAGQQRDDATDWSAIAAEAQVERDAARAERDALIVERQQRAAGDERTAFEATYLADYDDPGAACEREHFGKGYRAGMAAQSAKEQGESDA